VHATPDRVIVLRPGTTGFTVIFHDLGSHFQVHCDGWSEDFTTQESALACFALALSDEARLKVTQRGAFPYRWEFQRLREGSWQRVSETRRLLAPFWRRRIVVFLQNAYLVAA
jgi:hypothetical protein